MPHKVFTYALSLVLTVAGIVLLITTPAHSQPSRNKASRPVPQQVQAFLR